VGNSLRFKQMRILRVFNGKYFCFSLSFRVIRLLIVDIGKRKKDFDNGGWKLQEFVSRVAGVLVS
jgi:hypothetical protein